MPGTLQFYFIMTSIPLNRRGTAHTNDVDGSDGMLTLESGTGDSDSVMCPEDVTDSLM